MEQVSLPDGLLMRRLVPNDYYKEYLQLLSQLTTVGNISYKDFVKQVEYFKERPSEYFHLVIEDTINGIIVAAGTVLMEKKFIHGLSSVAHLEDVVTHKDYRGKRLGIYMMQALKAIGKTMGAYKVILDCNDKNVPFYEKAINMKVKENQMVYYYEETRLDLVKSKL